MSLDLRRPAPWVVHAGAEGDRLTWRFSTRSEAEAAYELARHADVALLSMWRSKVSVTKHGQRRVVYTEERL